MKIVRALVSFIQFKWTKLIWGRNLIDKK